MASRLNYHVSKDRAHFSLSDDVNDMFMRFYSVMNMNLKPICARMTQLKKVVVIGYFIEITRRP